METRSTRFKARTISGSKFHKLYPRGTYLEIKKYTLRSAYLYKHYDMLQKRKAGRICFVIGYPEKDRHYELEVMGLDPNREDHFYELNEYYVQRSNFYAYQEQLAADKLERKLED